MRPQIIITPVVKKLLILNVLVFIFTWIMPMVTGKPNDFLNLFALHFHANENFYPFQLISSVFTHGGPMHLLMNMLGLIFLGALLETMWGERIFLIFYLACGVGGNVIAEVIDSLRFYEIIPFTTMTTKARILVGSSVGASGAIFGLLAALFLKMPNNEFMIFPFPFQIKMKYIFLFSMGVSLFFYLFPGNGGIIDHLGHLAGGIAGLLMMRFYIR